MLIKFTPACIYFILPLIFLTKSLSARELLTVFPQQPKDTPKEAFLVNKKETVTIKFPGRNLSKGVKIPNGDLTFAILPRPLGEDEEIPTNAPTVHIPQNWARCYLIFAYDPNNKVFPVKVTPIKASGGNFPLGHYQLINSSDANILAKLNKKVIRSRPGDITLIDPPIRERGSYLVNILAKRPEFEDPIIMASTKWVHDPKARSLIFIFNSSKQKRPRIFTLCDYSPPEE